MYCTLHIQHKFSAAASSEREGQDICLFRDLLLFIAFACLVAFAVCHPVKICTTDTNRSKIFWSFRVCTVQQ